MKEDKVSAIAFEDSRKAIRPISYALIPSSVECSIVADELLNVLIKFGV
jgi:hypothetical protein